MTNWKNLDTLDSYEEMKHAERVNLAEVMSGENGAKRVQAYSVPMAAGLTYNYAAKQVDENVLSVLSKLADEAQLTEKYKALYNGEVINTGEKRLVLHQLTRGQLGDNVVADDVDKRAFYVEQQEKIAEFAKKIHGRSPMRREKNLRLSYRSESAEAIWDRERCIWHWRTGQRSTIHLRWKQNSSAM